MIGRLLRAVDRAADKLEGKGAQSDAPSEAMAVEPSVGEVRMATSSQSASPLFTILAGVFFLVSLTSPLILLTVPVMLTLGMAVIAMFRKERPRWISPTIAVLTVLVTLSAANRLDEVQSNLRGDSPSNLTAVNLDDWNWTIDPSFAGGRGTIKWTAAVRNTSDRPVARVKVEFSTYDESGRLLASGFTYLTGIPPGGTRTQQSYADYYGTEKTADAQVAAVRFSGDC